MTNMQDIAKVATGFGLVLKESANRLVVKDLGSSAMQILKKLILTATDIAGLTRGRVQPHHSHEAIFEELKEQRDGSSSTTSPGYSVKGSAPRGKYGHKRKDGFSRDQGEGQQAEELFAPKKPEGLSVNFRESVSTSEQKSLSRRMSLPSVGSHLKGDHVREKGASDAAQTPQRTERTRSNKDTQTMGRGHAATSVRPGNSTQETGSGVETAKVARLDSGDGTVSTTKRKPRERRVPSTPLGRVLGFAGLGAGLAWGTVQESAKRFLAGPSLGSPGEFVLSPLMSETNAERVAVALCRMRGAALKMGQMLSIQDETLVPAPLLLALEKVRQGADIMPKSQLMKTITTELGPNWRAQLRSFDEEPIASASIGQVHRAITNDGKEVAMKVQYPGVANSIDSDIANVKLLLEYTNIIPGGLYLDQAMRVAKDELARECNYRLEAANQKRFRELVKNEKGLYVPLVFDHLSSKHVLTTELVSGIPIDQVTKLDQGICNNIGTQLLSLTLKELFVFRFMQTDPNWGNFLYDEATGTLNLIDFGAARDYPKHFVDNYLKMILACANKNRAQVLEMSIKLGFLTGQETKIMLDAHTEAAFVIGVPFQKPGPFDFGSSDMPQRVVYLGPTMLKYRLTPPPDEGYSLHRKLSGAFCACKKLGAVVRCREMFMQVYDRHKFSDKDEPKPGRAPGSRI